MYIRGTLFFSSNLVMLVPPAWLLLLSAVVVVCNLTQFTSVALGHLH